MMRSILAALAFVLACAGAAHAQTAYDNLDMLSIEHGGARRSVGLYVPPSYRAGQPAPLIVALHGRFSSAKAFHAMSNLREAADARGAILLYPETVDGFWNDGGFAALRRVDPAYDDAGFVAAAVAAVQADYAIDPEQLFLTGYDSGGQLAYNLACNGPLRLAGVAVVSALLWDYATTTCANAPAPLLVLHGRRDDLMPVRGGSPGEPITASRLSVDQTIERWRGVNGCATASAAGRDDSVAYLSCSGAAFAYVGVAGGEHDWFHSGAAYQLNHQGVDATALINTFFFDRASFTLPNARSEGRARSYFVYAPPSYDAGRPTPVVVVLHGRPQTASGVAQMTRMNAAAARHGFIVVYPQGIDNQWNGILDVRGMRAVASQNDVRFLETLMQDLRVDLNIDPARMYVTGYSNGGFMTLRLACDAADTFAAFAAVGSALYTELTSECRGGRRAPVLIMHGTADRSVPYTGVVVNDGQGREPTNVTLSVQETVRYFINKNGCGLSGESARFPERGQSPGSFVIRFTPSGCPSGSDVVFYLINGGGHTWPGEGNNDPTGPAGITNMDINANDAIWEFFARQSLAPQAQR